MRFASMWIASLTVAGFATEVPAESGPGFHPDQMIACMRLNPIEEWELCIGLASNYCLSFPEGETVVGSLNCIHSEITIWDEMLNSSYQSLRSSLNEEDPSGTLSDALRDMQRAWIVFRDRSCDFAVAGLGGEVARQVQSNCLLEATARQAIELMWMAESR